ncbi:hypothetical protein QN391_25900, partial [Pseudomonas sp. CCI1.2]|nr:hypothetical protein [Pseudomonas sp. CCI1.2]
SAGCSSKESIGNKYQSAHTDEIMMLPYTRNLTNFENNNSSTHGPIIILIRASTDPKRRVGLHV